MNIYYRNIGIAIWLFLAIGCAKDTIKEEAFLPDNEGSNNEILPPNEFWGWVGKFPGDVPERFKRLENVEVKISGNYVQMSDDLNASVKNWQSSGLYVPPAEFVKVTVPAGITGLKYQIGVAAVEIPDNQKSNRYKKVTKSGTLKPGVNNLHHDFGGHLYFYFEEVPAIENVTLLVQGAVKSLDYVQGTTDWVAWKTAVQDTISTGMIWGELIGKRVILTLPLKTMQIVENPNTLLEFYDEIISQDIEALAGVDFVGQNVLPWRIYADIQLPMEGTAEAKVFSGYPMAFNSSIQDMDSAAMKLYDYQQENVSYLLAGLVDNYGMNWIGGSVLGNAPLKLLNYHLMNRKGSWPGTMPDFVGVQKTATADRAFRYTGLKEEEKLAMLLQLAQEYGWDIIAYITKRSREELSKESIEPLKNDLFAVYATEYAGVNLNPFFDAWKFPLTSFAYNHLNKYPAATDFWSRDFDKSKYPDLTAKREPLVMEKEGMPVRDSIYERSKWVVKVSSEQAGAAANMIDGNKGTFWNAKWSGDHGGQYPHWASFEFNQCSFNYVYIQHRQSGSNDSKTRIFQIEILDEDTGEWVAIDGGKDFYMNAKDENIQRFYLERTYTSSGVRLHVYTPHTGNDEDRQQKKSLCVSEFGIGLLE